MQLSWTCVICQWDPSSALKERCRFCKSIEAKHSLTWIHQLSVNNADTQGEWEDSGGWQLYFQTVQSLIFRGIRGLLFWDLSLTVCWQLDNAALIQTPSCAPLDLPRALRADSLNETHILCNFLFPSVKASYSSWLSALKSFSWPQHQTWASVTQYQNT